jgi:hypothetical protein
MIIEVTSEMPVCIVEVNEEIEKQNNKFFKSGIIEESKSIYLL